jgi:ketosteroid isomerase-like protein
MTRPARHRTRRPALAAVAVLALAAPGATPLAAQDSTPRRTRVPPPARGPAVAPATDADSVVRRGRVVAALDSFVVAFNDLDSARFAARWATQASAFFPFADTPQRVDGRDAVLARFATYFARMRRERAGPPYLRIVPRELDVRLLDAGTALATFTMQVAGGTARRTLVLVRERDGAWRIAHLHGSGGTS